MNHQPEVAIAGGNVPTANAETNSRSTWLSHTGIHASAPLDGPTARHPHPSPGRRALVVRSPRGLLVGSGDAVRAVTELHRQLSGSLSQWLDELVQALAQESESRPRDADRRIRRAGVIKHGRGHTAHPEAMLLVVHRVAQAPHSCEVLSEILSARDRVGGHGRQPEPSQGRLEAVRWPNGEQHLAHGRAVAKNSRPHPSANNHRVLARNLGDVDDLTFVEHAEVHGLAAHGAELLKIWAGFGLEVELCDRAVAKVHKTQAERIAAG